ncbi:MAG TPA: signal peptidase I [Bryobacteraceae bacterium]
MTPNDSDSPRPIAVGTAFYFTLGLGVLSLAMVPWQPGAFLQALIYLCAAWGIRRKHAWAAYGLALLTLVPILVMMGGQIARIGQAGAVAAGSAALFTLALLVVLFLAGRALERQYGRRGSPWPWMSVTVLLVAFLALFGLYQNPTGSMEPTLEPGDKLAVWKDKGNAPARGEMVVHIYPVHRNDTFIKRVVGLPGDRIRIVNKQLYINGTQQTEPYAEHTTSYVDSYRDNFPSEPTVPLFPGATSMLEHNVVNGEVVVPEGHYFVLGDNRDMSLDSRYWGFIDQSDIIGKPKFVYYSARPVGNPNGNESKLEILRVRWSRFFRPVS